LFTTHTPVAAGHDYFPPELAERYLAPIAESLGCELETVMALGRYTPEEATDTFCPTVLALRTAGMRNGVSPLHGGVTRSQWRGLWPRVPESEIPVGHVTNGIHYQSWLSPEFDTILHDAFGPEWRTTSLDPDMWRGFLTIDDRTLWDARNAARARLVDYTRAWLTLQDERRRRGSTPKFDPTQLLDPDALTIGFVGRFVAYKRPTLFLHDRERLARILGNESRPVQIVFAGKAHPRDHAGKGLLRDVVAFARDSGLRHRVVFLEDFDMAMDRYLVQGVDLWLNTPRRPLEACGISGMKAGANGALNLSTIDGWWDEAWKARDLGAAPIGWSIGDETDHDDPVEHDRLDALSFYDQIENHIVPAFYDRDADGIPTQWLASMKQAIATLSPTWNSHRMVREYTDAWYAPSQPRAEALSARHGRRAKKLAERLARLRRDWDAVAVARVEAERRDDTITVRAALELGPIKAGDVEVQVWVHPDVGEASAVPVAMKLKRSADSATRYTLAFPNAHECDITVAVRAVANTEDLIDPFDGGVITWSEGIHLPWTPPADVKTKSDPRPRSTPKQSSEVS
ncbi:MAG: alpha-glucan family phosphorylase, partial [Acidimicrobiia bacterium]